MGKLSLISKRLAMTALIAFSSSVIGETLEVTYLNNPKSLRTFADINIQCAAHYLSNASKLTDDIAKKFNMNKDEAIALFVKTSQFHSGLAAFIEGNIHGRSGKQPMDTDKMSAELMRKVVVAAASYSPLPAEYQSAAKLCQSIQDNPQSYTSKLDRL